MDRLSLVDTPTENGEDRLSRNTAIEDGTLGLAQLSLDPKPTTIGKARLPRNSVSQAPNSWSLGRLRSSRQWQTEPGISCHQCGVICGDLDSFVRHWRKMKDLRHASAYFPYKDYPGKFQECVLCRNGPFRSLAMHGPHCPASQH